MEAMEECSTDQETQGVLTVLHSPSISELNSLVNLDVDTSISISTVFDSVFQLHLPRFPAANTDEEKDLAWRILNKVNNLQLGVIDEGTLDLFISLPNPSESVRKLNVVKIEPELSSAFMEIYKALKFQWAVEEVKIRIINNESSVSLKRHFLTTISQSLKTLSISFDKDKANKEQNFNWTYNFSNSVQNSHLPTSLTNLGSLSLFNCDDTKNSALPMYNVVMSVLQLPTLSSLKIECSSTFQDHHYQLNQLIQQEEMKHGVSVTCQSLIHLLWRSNDSSIFGSSFTTKTLPNLTSVTLQNPSSFMLNDFLLQPPVNLETLKLLWDQDNKFKVNLTRVSTVKHKIFRSTPFGFDIKRVNLLPNLKKLKVLVIRSLSTSEYPITLTDSFVANGLLKLPPLKNIKIHGIPMSKKGQGALRKMIDGSISIKFKGSATARQSRMKGQPKKPSRKMQRGKRIHGKDDYLDLKPLLSQWTPQGRSAGGRNKVNEPKKRKPTTRQVQRQRERKKSTSRVVDDDRKKRNEGKTKNKEKSTDFCVKSKY